MGDENVLVVVVLVGKGIMFDLGGYLIKLSEGMLGMKCDMGGVVIVIVGLVFVISCGINKCIKLFLCCVENFILGYVYKFGDILIYKNGIIVEIVNIDVEGCLVLVDGLMVVGEFGVLLIIDVVMLIGVVFVVVG